jgi:3-phosphoshikimate 1-carboxyvinyltransferase
VDKLLITPVERPVDGTVTVPGSKSITNRALILAALANGEGRLSGALYSDDTRSMAESLVRLGIEVQTDAKDQTFTVRGHGGQIPAREADLFVGNSGTTSRFLTAFVAAGEGSYRIDGVPRMRERPIRDLLDALRPLGVDAMSEAGNGCPPVVVQARGIAGGRTTMRADVSSQYLTGLLMVSPLAKSDVIVDIDGDLASKPYVDITLKMMRQWGVEVENDDYRHFTVRCGQQYHAQVYAVEPDASSASYFFAAAAVTGGRVRVPGLSRESLQGDVAFVEVLEQMGARVEFGQDYIEVRGGALRGVDVDMNPISDTVMTLAAIAPFASSPTTIRSVGHIRHKETDRIAALAAELTKLGVSVEERADGLRIDPCPHLRPAEIETYDDHRMAMSFAITGLKAPGVTILDPGCVAKTFPDFFPTLQRLVSSPPA